MRSSLFAALVAGFVAISPHSALSQARFGIAGGLAVPVSDLGASTGIVAGGAFSCARRASGDVFCWGDSEFGKAGDGRLPVENSRNRSPLASPASSSGPTGLSMVR